MFRRISFISLTVIAAIALTISVSVTPAQAQSATPTATPTPYERSPYHSSNLGDSFVSPIIPPNTYELKAGSTDTTTVGGTGGGDSSAGLAATGAETDAFASIGVALLTVGGAALVASRRYE